MPEIQGYRELCLDDIAVINNIKDVEKTVMALIAELEQRPVSQAGYEAPDGSIDPRWRAVGRTDIQTGFMALVRAVAQPTT